MTKNDSMNAIKALKEYFGYSKFRVNQEEIINAILDNGCAVSPKPRKAPDASKESNKSNITLFPTIY